MTQSSAEKPAKKSRWRRFLKWSARALVVLVVVSIALYAAISYWTARAIRNEIARIRAAGEPVTFADLDAMTPQADPAQDAGPLYQAAAILVIDAAPDESNDIDAAFFSSPAEQNPSQKTLGDADDLLKKNRPALDLLDQGASLSGCNATVEIEDGISAALRNFSRFNGLSHAASLRTRVLAFRHQDEQAVQSALAELPLIRVFDRQPILVASLVRASLLSRDFADIAWILERSHPSDASLAALANALAKTVPESSRRTLVADRVYFIETSRSVLLPDYQPGPGEPDALPLPESWTRTGLGKNQIVRQRVWAPPLPESWTRTGVGLIARRFARDNLLLENRFITATSLDWPARLDAVNDIADHPGSTWNFSGIATHILAPSFARAMLIDAQVFSVWQSTQAAIQVERYRLSHNGALPDSLGNLPNATNLPTDPLTSKPLLYAKTPDGYCIYSAGYHPPADRDKNPIPWSKRWGISIRTHLPQ